MAGAVAHEQPGLGARVIRFISAVVALALLTLVVVTPFELRTQFVFGVVVLGLGLLVGRWQGRFATLTMIVLSVVVSTRYIYWRVTGTLSFELTMNAALGFVLLSAELYAYLVLLLGYFQLAEPFRRKPIPLPDDVSTWPSVDIFVPTYNEPLEVVRATVLAAKAMDWPADKLRVHILDDGRRPEFRAFAAEAGVIYLVRPDNKHAKAGNLNHAMTKTRGDYIAIFDCDHVPTRSFLQLTMGLLLRDPKLAMVQTPHHFYSPDPFERNMKTFRSMPNEGELFYGLIQPGNDLWNAVFFCGSCAVLRRTALEEIGGIAVETVTEDAHTMLKLHRRGWASAYLELPQAAGLATESLSAHVGQRIRWARGMAQIFRLDNPLLGRGLKLPQRLCYASAMLHFFYGVPRLIFLLSPLSFLFFEAQIFNALPVLVLSYALPHLFHSVITNSRLQRQYRHSFWSEVYETVLAFYVMIPTTLALIAPRKGKFNVTAKGGLVERPFFSARIAAPYLVLLAVSLFGMGAGVWRLIGPGKDIDVVLINMAWTGYNLIILGATLAVAWEQRQVRRSPRIAVQLPAMLRLPDGRTVRSRTIDLSATGASLQLVRDEPLPVGEPVLLSALIVGVDERPIPALVVDHQGGVLRLRWDALTTEEESWLVQMIFSRANAWTVWKRGRKADFAPRAFVDIFGHALRAFALAVLPGRRGPALPAAHDERRPS